MIKYEPNPDLSDKGYQGLKIAVKVRDRLMHPKLSVDVSDQEMEAIEEGETWFLIKYQDLRGAQANFDERLKAWMLELTSGARASRVNGAKTRPSCEQQFCDRPWLGSSERN